jgi:adenylosuccinate lyase
MLERYSHPEMARVWSLENKLAKWLAVEIAVCEGWARRGVIPPAALDRIRQARVDPAAMARYEEETRHDVTAFLRALADAIGPDARFVHLGLTSSDVVDTALALQVQEASAILLDDLDRLLAVLERRALEHRDTVMIGRTHGVHAEPTTFGFKLAGWIAELRRDRERLAAAARQLAVGKIAGAVGTHASVPPDVEEYACQRLGLAVEPVATQIIQRDRHAHYLTTLALIGGTIERIATEIRGLQRTEIREVEEPFGPGQTGSSAMPHKRNPELSERLCGLARLLRGHALAALENIALWHERDISNSSVERLAFPQACLLLDYMLRLLTRIIEGLRVFPERMRRNLDLTRGLVFSQRVLLALIEKGLDRQTAYSVVQRNAMRVWEEDQDFQTLLAQDPVVQQHLTPAELAALFDLNHYLRYIPVAFERLGLGTAQPAPAGEGATDGGH